MTVQALRAVAELHVADALAAGPRRAKELAGDVDAVHRVLRALASAAARPGARLLLLESVIPVGNEPHGSKWLDLLMPVLSGGRERTKEEWRVLLAHTGLDFGSIEDGLIQARCP